MIIVAAFTGVVIFIVVANALDPVGEFVDPEWETLFTWVVVATAWLNVAVLYLQSKHRLRSVRLVAFPLVLLYCVLISILVIGDRSQPAERYAEFHLFFFLPILYASLSYEVRGAVAAACIVCLVSAFAEIARRPQLLHLAEMPTSLVVRTALWMIVGAVTGFLTREERRLRERSVEALDQAHQKMRELSALIDIGRRLNSTLNMQQLLDRVVSEATRAVRAEAGSLFLVDEETDELVFAVVTGDAADSLRGRRIRRGQGIAGWVAENSEPVLVPDTSKDERWYPGIDAESGFSTRSMLCVPLQARDRSVGALQLLNKENGGQFDRNDLDLCSAMATQVVVALDNAKLIERMESAFFETVESLATTLEFRDTETEGHSRRVRDLTLAIARRMELAEGQLLHIGHGALLHDIGKIAVPDAILHKPGKLNDDEWEEMKQHCRQGFEMVKRMKFLADASDIVYSHQERFDGGGYPRGLGGEDIHIGARIFAVADAFDAMTSDRPYRKAMPVVEAKAEIQDNSGTQFDPDVVEAFLEMDDAALEALRSARYTPSDELTRTAVEMIARETTSAAEAGTRAEAS